jgi:hypothetical protein
MGDMWTKHQRYESLADRTVFQPQTLASHERLYAGRHFHVRHSCPRVGAFTSYLPTSSTFYLQSSAPQSTHAARSELSFSKQYPIHTLKTYPKCKNSRAADAPPTQDVRKQRQLPCTAPEEATRRNRQSIVLHKAVATKTPSCPLNIV